MEEKEVIHTLQQLKQIEPRKEFVRISRATVLATPQREQRSWFGLPFVQSLLGSALAILLFVGGFIAYNSTQSTQLSGLNNDAIEQEMVSTGDINISLTEISYQDEANRKINVALNELAKGTSR